MYEADPYPPLGTLKPFARELWIADGPVVRMRYLFGSTLPFPTRMTVARLADGRLWVHSPIGLTEALRAELSALGPVAALVAPNRLHVTWLGDWAEAYPEAETWAAPGVREATGAAAHVLGEGEGPDWGAEIEPILVPGGFMTEADFFHHPSRTLILTDLLENFEADKVHGRMAVPLLRLGGVLAPEGRTPRDLMLTFLPKRAEARAAAERMLALAPERIVIAHGRCVEREAPAALRRALAWTGAGRS